MAIDDNTVYGLTGAQVKELPEKIEAVKGLARELTSADYNYPANSPDGVAFWLLDPGTYYMEPGVKYYWNNNSSDIKGGLVVTGGYVGVLFERNNTQTAVRYFYTSAGAAFSTGDTSLVKTSAIINNLTSTNTDRPLSANQGKVLKDMIDNLPTGGAIELTSADFNYDYGNTGSFNKVALWLLPPGEYYTNTLKVSGILSNTQILSSTSTQLDNQQQMRTFNVIKAPTADGVDYVEIEGYRRLSSDSAGTPVIGLMRVRADGTFDYKTALLDQDMVAQTTGTSTTNVMSQNAISNLIFGNISSQDRIHLGNTSSGGDYTIAIGRSASVSGTDTTVVGALATAYTSEATVLGARAYAGANSSVALGYGAKTTKKGEINIGTSNASSPNSYGYNSSAYRLLSGLYDPQSDHDAATKGYCDNAIINGGTTAPTTVTVGAVGTQYTYVDTTGTPTAHLCVCTEIDTTDPSTPVYTWQTLV